ncbi:hypothetical protein ACFU9Y_15870 [Streptomyces sp. NPDC057621]|uniref:STAS domain-containing protein n=1 Tax=Streptomyces liliiviolaceus TaxID=2823109 RepID=A0A941B7M1_9ACTN|nr:hypothetical protein [Streptomyces liliiviolaceus]MBQ0850631.1 hypothetical protein [Streptomyces liliiviolaceus]
MSTSFGDDLLLIHPLILEPGIKLYGQVMGAHKIPLNLALLACRRQASDITVDLTHVDYLSQSALETLVGAARTLPAPAHLTLRAQPRLGLAQRLADHGWHQTQSLHLAAA